MSDLLLLAPAALALALLLLWRRKRDPQENASSKSIAVDGSNVMYWGGEPSAKVLFQVLRAVKARDLAPIVFFDANVGYKLSGRFLNADDLAPLIGVSADQIQVVDKGVVADQAILEYSRTNRLQIVSNDRYRDWRGRFPHVAKKGQMVRGQFRDGTVIWRDKGSFR